MITYGTNPGMGMAITAEVPAPIGLDDESERRSLEKALDYMGLEGGQPLLGHKIDVVFLGSCTNSRISDLRLAAQFIKGHKIAPNVRMMVVPGSQQVKKQAEAEEERKQENEKRKKEAEEKKKRSQGDRGDVFSTRTKIEDMSDPEEKEWAEAAKDYYEN